jgi:hypothetical protein
VTGSKPRALIGFAGGASTTYKSTEDTEMEAKGAEITGYDACLAFEWLERRGRIERQPALPVHGPPP